MLDHYRHLLKTNGYVVEEIPLKARIWPNGYTIIGWAVKWKGFEIKKDYLETALEELCRRLELL